VGAGGEGTSGLGGVAGTSTDNRGKTGSIRSDENFGFGSNPGSSAGGGVVRIVWGYGRQFPSSNVN
jgi:hypothetical protein